MRILIAMYDTIILSFDLPNSFFVHPLPPHYIRSMLSGKSCICRDFGLGSKPTPGKAFLLPFGPAGDTERKYCCKSLFCIILPKVDFANEFVRSDFLEKISKSCKAEQKALRYYVVDLPRLYETCGTCADGKRRHSRMIRPCRYFLGLRKHIGAPPKGGAPMCFL